MSIYITLREEAPAVLEHPDALAGAPFYAASHDDTVEAHDSGLARMRDCTCADGYVFVGRIGESQHDLDGEVVEYRRTPCRRCNAA